jgi:hypothetical protein
MLVIPAKAGTQRLGNRQRHWVPAFAGMTDQEALKAQENFNSTAELLRAFAGDHVSRNSSQRILNLWRRRPINK